ncbi:ATP-binding protein [Hyphomicrobium sp.]|uniref:sensor histidine kinase n=1 Tax=Hyphomicrobium sp. TaxID=82 RepID=UPI0025C37B02|nr:ATP-binding protein [Hyphomicrobium sp.]
MTSPHKLTQRTAFRLAGFVAIVITLTNVLIFAILFFIISQQLGQHLKAHIDEVRETLADVQGDEVDGFRELSAAVARHALVAQSDEDIYLLTDTDGKYIAGNVSSLDRFEGWRTIPWNELKLIGQWSSSRASDAVIGTWTPVKGGYLFVGDGNGDIKDAQRLLLTGLLWGIVLSVICALVGGYLLGLKAQRRVEEMEHVLDAVASGDFNRRIPRNAAADDIDHVAALINVTLDRLQRLIGNLKQVSVDIAHDLRTPISRMRQKLETVRSGPSDIATYKAAVDQSICEIDNIAETFDALLRISEIEAGAQKAKFVDVELNGLLANIIDALEAVAEEHQHRLRALGGAGDPVIVRGDRRLLNQLFVNLFENSIVHCPRGSEIEVELINDAQHPIVRVRDTGRGIPAEEREKVFRRLYRLEKSRTTRGSGLGLSLVAAIAELHSAKLTLADNKPGLVVEVAFDQARRAG